MAKKTYTMRVVFLWLLMVAVAAVTAQSTEGIYNLQLGKTAAITTVKGLPLPSSFGGSDYYYAVVRIDGLKPGTKYMAAITYDGGTGIYYAFSWINGNPLSKDWFSFVGIGSSTGTGVLQPGYTIYHLFAVDSKSTSGTIYLSVRSDKPWQVQLTVSTAKPEITRDTKNSYGYYCVDDLTDGNRIFYVLDKK